MSSPVIPIPASVSGLLSDPREAEHLAEQVKSLTSSYGWAVVLAALSELEESAVGAFSDPSREREWMAESAKLAVARAVRALPELVIGAARESFSSSENTNQ